MARFLTGGVDSIVSFPNQSQFQVQVITVVTAGTPVQLPNIPVPDGVEVAIRAYEGNGTKRIYLANSSTNTADPTKRLELRRGEAISLSITNTNLIYIDASGNGASIELILEA